MRALRAQLIPATATPAKPKVDEKKAAMERANRTMCELAEVLTLSSKALEECDDVQNVFANFDVSDEVMAALD